MALSTIHLIVVLRTTLRSWNSPGLTSLLRPRAVCPDCSRTWDRQRGTVADDASEPLLGENEEEDMEANPKGKGAIRLEDDEQGPSTG